MHAHDEGFLVVTAVEDADVAAVGEALHATPQIIVIEVLGGRRLEGKDLATLRIDAGHDVLDGAVLPGGVHGLKDEQQRPLVVCVKFVL